MSGFYRCEIKTLSRKDGKSAAETNRYDRRKRHKDKDRADLVGVGAVNMPAWAGDPHKYWLACDAYERANGLLARRAILSYPVELPSDERDAVVREWLVVNCPNMPASWVIHDAGDGNPHAHILISERVNDGIDRTPETWFRRANPVHPEKGGARKARIGSHRKEWLMDARKSWADVLNKRLPPDKQVDHRSLVDRGIYDRAPQPKIGQKVIALERKGVRTRVVSRIIEDAMRRCTVRCLTFWDDMGREITFRAARDFEDRIELVGRPSVARCREIARMCREKGWASVEITGSDAEWVRLMRAELERIDIKVFVEGENYEQGNEHHRGADGGDGGRGSEKRGESRGGRDAGATYDRPGYGADRGSGRGQDGRVGGVDADAQYTPAAAKTKASSTNASTAGAVDADYGLSVGDFADRRADIRTLAAGDSRDGLSESSRSVDMQKADLTKVQVVRQLDAMRGVEVFEVGIRDSRSGRMQNFELSRSGVLQALPRLKRENSKGCDIYIRPAPKYQHPFVLLDDIGLGTINKMLGDGIKPVLEVETSPRNYQVWIRLPDSFPRPVRKAVERFLAGRYGGDIGSCDGGHYGRLAGFTNRKPAYVTESGMSPYCKLSAHRPAVVLPDAVWSEIKAAIESQTKDAPKAHFPAAPAAAGMGGVISPETAQEIANRQYAIARERYGGKIDFSRADFFVARVLLQRGADSDLVRDTIAATSPDLSVRKSGHVDDYLDRTIRAAAAAVEADARSVSHNSFSL